MNDSQLDNLWAIYLEGKLSPGETESLEESLSGDAALFDDMMADAEMDGTLRALGRSEEPADGFVERVLLRLDPSADETYEFPVLPCQTSSSDAFQQEPRVVPPPLPPPVVDPRPAAAAAGERRVRPSDSAWPAIDGHRSVSVQTRQRETARARRRTALRLCAAASVAVALVAAIFVIAVSNQPSNVARRQAPVPRSTISPGDVEVPPLPDPDHPKIVEERAGRNSSGRAVPDDVSPGTRAPRIRPDDPPVDQSPPHIVEQPARIPRPPQPDGVEHSSDTIAVVARLTKTTSAVWDVQPQSELTRTRLSLREGTAEVTMYDGAIVTLHGPVEFQVDSPSSMSVTRGRLSATVPRRAIGFSVQTPSSRVVDLGTEFDVEVDQDGATAVRVLRGKVEMAALAEDGSAGRRWRLGEGQFKTVARDGSSLDWNLALSIDPVGRGSIKINGVEMAFGGPADFGTARRTVLDEFARLRRDAVARVGVAGDPPFRGIMEINGEKSRFEDRTGLDAAGRLATEQLNSLQELFDRLNALRGSININGIETNFDNWQELLKAQESLRQTLNGVVGTRGAAGAGGARGSINVNGVEMGFGNFDELMKAQQEVLRRFGGFGTARDVNPDPRRDGAREGLPIPGRINGVVPRLDRKTMPAAPPEGLRRDGAALVKPPADAELADAGVPPASAADLVQRSLQAELRGQSETRHQLLASALATDANYAPARWHSGQVRVAVDDEAGDEWLPVKEAERRAAADSTLAEYARVRAANAADAAGNEALAKWCRAHGMHDREKTHWAAVLRAQPGHKTARERLGLKEYNGRLLTRDQIAEVEKLQVEAYRLRKEWLPKLYEWRKALLGNDAAASAEARGQLHAIRDPRLVPLLESSLSLHSQSLAEEVVLALGTITDQAATDSLIRHALLCDWPAVRRAAALQLKERPMQGYVPFLIAVMESPLEFSSWIREGVYTGDVYYSVKRKGQHVDQVLEGNVSIKPVASFQIDDPRGPDLWRTLTAVEEAMQSPARDVERELERAVDRYNDLVAQFNALIRETLATATGKDYGLDPSAWYDWWTQYNEYYVPPARVLAAYESYNLGVLYDPVARPPKRSCFPAGTLVWTQTGRRPIEDVRVGDFVLSQDPKSGELTCQPVLETTLRPPSPILEIRIDGEIFKTTKGHPFWLNGHGWSMAKLLQPGDRLHGINGSSIVEMIREAGMEAEAHNLVVGKFNTFFVGETGVLVHDNTPAIPPGVSIPGEQLTAN